MQASVACGGQVLVVEGGKADYPARIQQQSERKKDACRSPCDALSRAFIKATSTGLGGEVATASVTESGDAGASSAKRQTSVVRRLKVSEDIGAFFTFKMQMDLKMDHHLCMLGGSSVKMKHVTIHDVERDGFCLLRAVLFSNFRAATSTELRSKVKDLISASLETAESFDLRLVSLMDALRVYVDGLPVGACPSAWVVALVRDLDELLKDHERRRELVEMDRELPLRREWETRILCACTRNAADDSSTDGDGLLLWVGESELGSLVRLLGVSVRYWQSIWVTEVDEGGAETGSVESYALVNTYEPSDGVLQAASPCIDIVRTEDHFDRMEFKQDRYNHLKLNPRLWAFTPQQVERLTPLVKEMAKLDGLSLDSELERVLLRPCEILEAERGAVSGTSGTGVKNWKARGAGTTGTRLSSEIGSGGSVDTSTSSQPPKKRVKGKK